jgi:hypothetical protein
VAHRRTRGTEGGDMLGSAIVIPGIIVLILVIVLIVWLVRRA